MIGIYKITSPSGKVYIGQSIDIEKRFKYYKRKSCNGQTILLRSFNKYGVENHKFEILCECEIFELNQKERYYQDLYSVLENGLNCILTKTNDKSGVGVKHTEETKLKISIANTGKIKSIETRLLLSKNKIGNTIWVGRKHNENTKKLMSENSKSRSMLLDLNTGVFYYSMSEYCNLYNLKISTLYTQLSGKRKKNKYSNLKII
jgi:group I intron endonuclease